MKQFEYCSCSQIASLLVGAFLINKILNLGNGKEEVVYSRSDMVSYIHLDRGVRMDRTVGGQF